MFVTNKSFEELLEKNQIHKGSKKKADSMFYFNKL